MPRVKLSAGFTAIAGKQGGSVWATNQGGLYFRNNKFYGKVPKMGQVGSRANMAYISGLWRQLPPTNQIEWTNAGPDFPTTNIFGDARIPTGYELFMRLNLNIVKFGNTLLSSPPSPSSFPAYGPLEWAVLDATHVSINFPYTVPANEYVMVWGAYPKSAGVNKIPTSWKFFGYQSPVGATNINLISSYRSFFPAPANDQKIFLKTSYLFGLTGIQGAVEYSSAIVGQV